MPKGDGTGPQGQGPRTGLGRGQKSGRGSGKGTSRSGRMGGIKVGAGPEGQCVCPSCGTKVKHQAGAPCYQMKCPECGKAMVRD